jgi:hypothetical protein
MKNAICLVFVALAVCSAPGFTKDKDSSLEREIKDEIRDEIYGDDKQKGKGRPDNPGEHGRDNAAQKQSENPGKGSKANDSWEDVIRDEIDDKDKDKDKSKGKKNKN